MPGIGEAGMTLIGAELGLAGRKPSVPPPAHVDPQKAQKTAISGNIAALPDIEKLTTQFNQFSLDELMSQLDKISPGSKERMQSAMDSQLKGEVPADVMRQIKQGVGAKAFAAGFSPGQRAAAEGEVIGSTSYKIQQEGVSSLTRWIAQVEGMLPKVNFGGMFVTYAQEVAAEQWNETMRFNQQWMQNRIDAMPSPVDQAMMGALQAFGQTVDQYGSAALGMMGGGAGSFTQLGQAGQGPGGFSNAQAVGGLFGGGGGGGSMGGRGGNTSNTGGSGGNADSSVTGLDWLYNQYNQIGPVV